MKANYMLK